VKIQIQPNRASCFITALAICIDEPVKELMTIAGHDGTEIVFPERPVPSCYRGFHPSELAYIAYIYGWAVSELCMKLEICHSVDDVRTFKPPYTLADILHEVKNCIIITDKHAYAWDGLNLINPNGSTLSIESIVNVVNIYLVNRIKI
jgi:hypothetical protein